MPLLMDPPLARVFTRSVVLARFRRASSPPSWNVREEFSLPPEEFQEEAGVRFFRGFSGRRWKWGLR